MEVDEYALFLGKIVSNLQALEFVLRANLSGDDSPDVQLPEGKMLLNLKIGERVPENALTNYKPLQKLIECYNERIGKSDPNLKVDLDVVKLRDAIAHGRVGSLLEEEDPVLLKFGPPRNGQVTVTFSERMTRDWLSARVRYVYAETLKVVEATDRERRRLANQKRSV